MPPPPPSPLDPRAAQAALTDALSKGHFITRAEVLAECESTQSIARDRATPGLMILALSQTSGRGRLGRSWAPTQGQGVAATFTLNARQHDPAHVALVAGLAALETCAQAMGHAHVDAGLGLRWPNDVVEAFGPMRKLAGVLVERVDNLLLVGIGINVLQQPQDWPDHLQGRATSIAELVLDPHMQSQIEHEARDQPSTITQASAMLARHLDHALRSTPQDAAANWQRLNVLQNRTATFEHNGTRHTGVVESIDPSAEIILRLPDGSTVRLPALSTSMVHDA